MSTIQGVGSMRWRRVWLLAGVLLVVPSLGSDVRKEYDGATARDELEGTWLMVSVEYEVLLPFAASIKTYCGGRWEWPVADETFSGTYTTDAGSKPARLDETNLGGTAKGETIRYIYERDGDSLRLGYFPRRGSARPNGFDAKGLLIINYKRVKK
jgi:uncharacterized protein (TIGR03067 family)